MRKGALSTGVVIAERQQGGPSKDLHNLGKYLDFRDGMINVMSNFWAVECRSSYCHHTD